MTNSEISDCTDISTYFTGTVLKTTFLTRSGTSKRANRFGHDRVRVARTVLYRIADPVQYRYTYSTALCSTGFCTNLNIKMQMFVLAFPPQSRRPIMEGAVLHTGIASLSTVQYRTVQYNQSTPPRHTA